MKINIRPTSRNTNILTQKIADEFLIYDLTADKAYSLNPTSAIVWQLCNGTRTIGEIAEAAAAELALTIPEELIWLAINQFKEDKLLEDNEVSVPNVYGMSRRQIIRKIGLASTVALPLISSVIAPGAAAAQSGCRANSQPCTTNSQCCSNHCDNTLLLCLP